MKPEFTVACTSADCADHDEVIHLDDAPSDYDRSHWCKSCRRPQAIRIVHDGRVFSNGEAFGQYALGLVKELIGLMKLVDRGVAEPEEAERKSELERLLTDVKCTCCLQLHLDEDGIPAGMGKAHPPDKPTDS